MAYTATRLPRNQRRCSQRDRPTSIGLRNEDGNALNELKNWGKGKLRETLDWIQKNVPARGRRANLIAVFVAKYLLDSSIFQDTELSWTDVVQIAADFNIKWGFPTEKGVVYNYGIWKPKKQRFRFIAGTRAMAREEGGNPRRSTGPPRQPLFRAHKALVRVLQHVEKALKEKEKLRQREEGIRAF